MKDVMRFKKKQMLSPRYIGPYLLLRHSGNVVYEFDLPSNLSSLRLLFHVSLLEKYIFDPTFLFYHRESGS